MKLIYKIPLAFLLFTSFAINTFVCLFCLFALFSSKFIYIPVFVLLILLTLIAAIISAFLFNAFIEDWVEEHRERQHK